MTTVDTTGQDLADRLDATLTPDPRRVIIKLFLPGEDSAMARTRATNVIERAAQLDEDEAATLLEQTRQRFSARHVDLDATLRNNYDIVHHRVARARNLSPTARMLVGAYFSHEYSVEAAAVCNPSMVAHPDQSGLDVGQLRVAVSLRQIGEGHVSSIGFATAVLGPGGHLTVDDRSGPLVTGHHTGASQSRRLLAAGLADEGWDNEVFATVLGCLPDTFDNDTFQRTVDRLPVDLLTRSTTQHTLERLRQAIAASYVTEFPAEVPLHRRVLWPAAGAESNGMEDARFVLFRRDDGGSIYRATYTAYDGRNIAARELSSADLRRFQTSPMRGPAARNKGMALFPRTVGGRHLALCRSDGETISLTTLDEENRWQPPVPLHRPRRGWELIQVGNCGSPIETEAGWLVLTHGVGPMRRYAIGAVLLDLRQPDRVIASLAGRLLSPADADRDGYVPNVVYSCGALLHAGVVWLPFGVNDTRVEFASVTLSTLLAAMDQGQARPDG